MDTSDKVLQDETQTVVPDYSTCIFLTFRTFDWLLFIPY